jgi:hypothetical protein
MRHPPAVPDWYAVHPEACMMTQMAAFIDRQVWPRLSAWLGSLSSLWAASAGDAAARGEKRSSWVNPEPDMDVSSMINWEEFGRSQLALTVLNLSQPG